MTDFFEYSSKHNCFSEGNRIVSKKCIEFDRMSLGVVLVNSAPFSLLGGNADDMGYHFLSDEDINKIKSIADCDYNILVIHHSIEWFSHDVKSQLREIIGSKYSLLLTGHEHESVGEEKHTNKLSRTSYVQGNALLGEASEGNGFDIVCIDTDINHMKAFSYIWKEDHYTSREILYSEIQKNSYNDLICDNEFLEKLKKDEKGKSYDEYYVFPGVEYKEVVDEEDVSSWEGDNEESIVELIDNYKRINICGKHKSGKSVLAARIYCRLLLKGKIPVLVCADDIQKKKINRTIIRAVEEQYGTGNDQFERFNQHDIEDRIVLLDDAFRIEHNVLNELLCYFEELFGCIILFSEEEIDFDIRKQVIEAVDEKNIHLTINPFLYRTRYQLIKKILKTKGFEKIEAANRAKEINNLINEQVKYFDLNPELIISYVEMYELQMDSSIRFTTGRNVFSMVYENSIQSRIIENANNMIEPKVIVNVLRELAFYMHFSKMAYVHLTEFSKVVDDYNAEYRQKVNHRLALNVAIDSMILKEKDNRIYFKDRTMIAYFVAQALNYKSHTGENINDKLEYLLRYLCFGINSDIVLFLALITDNPGILRFVIESAKNHFSEKEELSFDAGNIAYLTYTKISVKDTLPNKKEKEQREKLIDEQEKNVRLSELVELIDEYDYSEEELSALKNQMLVSFKYLEILSKALPVFCQDMKVDQQDELVELIYRCPNRFLFMMFNDIGDDFEGFCNDLYEEISELRSEKKQSEISLESIKNAITQVSATLVLALYQLVSMTSASPQSIDAINAFDYKDNANYRLQNLMMCARVNGIKTFSKKAKRFDKRAKSNLEKSIIKYTVRDYFLRNNIEMHGEADSLMTHFFKGNRKKEIQDKIIRNRYIDSHSNIGDES